MLVTGPHLRCHASIEYALLMVLHDVSTTTDIDLCHPGFHFWTLDGALDLLLIIGADLASSEISPDQCCAI